MKHNKLFVAGMVALVLAGCDTGTGGGGQDALTMSDYLKYSGSERFTDWGEGEVIRYRLNVAYKDEILAAFYNEIAFVGEPETFTRDWDTGKTAFEYVVIDKRNSGTFHSRMLRYLESNNNTTTYKGYDKPEIGATFSDNWGNDGTVSIEYLGQTSPSSTLTFNEDNGWGGRLYPGYYKVTGTRYRYLHIIDKDTAEMSDWQDSQTDDTGDLLIFFGGSHGVKQACKLFIGIKNNEVRVHCI